MKINCNEYCEVTLTESGKRTLRGQNFPHKLKGDVLKIQIWELMQVFGPSMAMGMAPPFELLELRFGEDIAS